MCSSETKIWLTDKELALTGLPWDVPEDIHPSIEERISVPPPPDPITFKNLREWSDFLSEAAILSSQLDDSNAVNFNPIFTPGAGGSCSEKNVQTKLLMRVFPLVNRLAENLGLNLRYNSAGYGSGRSCVGPDFVVLNSLQKQNLNDLSERVYGVGEVRGSWVLDMEPSSSSSYVDELKKAEKVGRVFSQALQDMFGDMVVDEAIFGFISTYNQTVFFYRGNAASKALYYSPVVNISDAPVEKFLYALKFAEDRIHMKAQLSRNLAKVAVPQTQMLYKLPEITFTDDRKCKRKAASEEINASNIKRLKTGRRSKMAVIESDVKIFGKDELMRIPVYNYDVLRVTGATMSLGEFGSALRGEIQGINVALKLFDLRNECMLETFVAEQIVYNHLKSLQGVCIPVLMFVGRLPHSPMAYLCLTNERNSVSMKDLLSSSNKLNPQKLKKNVINALSQIHTRGVLHGDISLTNILVNKDNIQFVGFEFSLIDSPKEDLAEELATLESLLDDTLNDLDK